MLQSMKLIFFKSFTIFYYMNVPSVEDVGFALNLFPSHCSKVICGGLGGDCFYDYFKNLYII